MNRTICPIWKNQYPLSQRPYRVGGNSSIYKVVDNKEIICKISKNQPFRDIFGLQKASQFDIAPKIIDCFYNIENDKYYYFMKRYTHDLHDVITNQNTPITFLQSVYLSQTLTQQVNKMHLHYIAHRDLKPENVVLDIKDYKYDLQSLRIIDFEAHCHTQYPDDLIQYGTNIYDPPEKQKQKQYNWITGDIYSLGLIKCLLITNGIYNTECFRYLHNPSILYESIMSVNKDVENHKFIKEYCNLLFLMIHKDPIKRPSLQKLLQFYKMNLL